MSFVILTNCANLIVINIFSVMFDLVRFLFLILCLTSIEIVNCTAKKFRAIRTAKNQINTEVNRIVGGVDASKGKWSFMGALMSTNKRHFCGLTLIDNDCCLTAAHCVTMGDGRGGYEVLKKSNLLVEFGVYNIFSSKGTFFEIEEIYVFPGFQHKGLISDLAMLKLKTPVNTSVGIKTVPLSMNLPESGTFCTVAGWGDLAYARDEIDTQIHPDKLQEVKLPIISNEKCAELYGEDIIRDAHLCTLEPKGGKDACTGDSGGPLICGSSQTGVVSAGEGCARPSTPGIYANIPLHNFWLKSKCKNVSQDVSDHVKSMLMQKSKARKFNIVVNSVWATFVFITNFK